MLKLFKKIVVFAVSIGVIGLGLPRSSGAAGGSLEGGKSSADEAATFKAEQSTDALGFAYIQPDSTEFEFPEDENKNLYRDIAVFVIASAFIAFFIIKVFLEGDTDESEGDDGGGKGIPPDADG